jgi:hypothetical protein
LLCRPFVLSVFDELLVLLLALEYQFLFVANALKVSTQLLVFVSQSVDLGTELLDLALKTVAFCGQRLGLLGQCVDLGSQRLVFLLECLNLAAEAVFSSSVVACSSSSSVTR